MCTYLYVCTYVLKDANIGRVKVKDKGTIAPNPAPILLHPNHKLSPFSQFLY